VNGLERRTPDHHDEEVSSSSSGHLGAALFAFAMPLPFWLKRHTFAISVLVISASGGWAPAAGTGNQRIDFRRDR